MMADVAWVVLHGGSHESGGLVTFETVLWAVVALLVVVGALYYAGAFEPSEGPGVEDAESGAGE